MKASRENTDKRRLRYLGLIALCDENIRAGRLADAANLLLKITPGQVPRELLADLAQLCRRCGLNTFGARLLYPLIRADSRKHGPPSNAERCEYATLISRLGYTAQALKILEAVNPDHHPEALLFRGYCHVSLWDYAAAAPLFARYLRYPLDPYARLIAMINMAAALIETECLEEARALLTEAMDAARMTNGKRLLANGHEMNGRIHMMQGDWRRAETEFHQARELFGRSQSLDQLLIEKNLAWMEAKKTASIAPLARFRRMAEERRHWDGVREADRLILHISFDAATFDRLAIGSPRPAYRDRVLKEFGRVPSASFLLGGEAASILDLADGTINGAAALKPGQKMHRLLIALAEDLYAPRSIGEIFSRLYPDEFYDVNHSTFRVAQVIHRVRAWCENLKLPLEIRQTESFYSLSLGKGLAIRVPVAAGELGSAHGAWLRLTSRLGGQDHFSVSDLCEKLDVSRTQAHRLLREFLKDQLIVACRQGRATFYCVASRSKAG